MVIFQAIKAMVYDSKANLETVMLLTLCTVHSNLKEYDKDLNLIYVLYIIMTLIMYIPATSLRKRLSYKKSLVR